MPKHLEGFPICEECGKEVTDDRFRIDWARFCDENCISKWVYRRKR